SMNVELSDIESDLAQLAYHENLEVFRRELRESGHRSTSWSRESRLYGNALRTARSGQDDHIRGVARPQPRLYIIGQSLKSLAHPPHFERGGGYAGRSTGFLTPHRQRRSGHGHRRPRRAGRAAGPGLGPARGAPVQGRQYDAA